VQQRLAAHNANPGAGCIFVKTVAGSQQFRSQTAANLDDRHMILVFMSK
jgi:hypothetical protein